MGKSPTAFVYMLTNDKGNILYTGSTENLKEGLYFHKRGMIAGFTKKYNVHRLVYFESCSSIRFARVRERELKGKTRAKKLALIKSKNPSWAELIP
jgi:putative endonuclease